MSYKEMLVVSSIFHGKLNFKFIALNDLYNKAPTSVCLSVFRKNKYERYKKHKINTFIQKNYAKKH